MSIGQWQAKLQVKLQYIYLSVCAPVCMPVYEASFAMHENIFVIQCMFSLE